MIIQVHRAAEKIYKSMICFVCFRLFICIETQCSDIITYYLDTQFRLHIPIWNIQQDSTKQEKKSFSILWSFQFYHTYLQPISPLQITKVRFQAYTMTSKCLNIMFHILNHFKHHGSKRFQKVVFCMFSSRSVIFEGRLRDSEFGTLRRLQGMYYGLFEFSLLTFQ